MPLKTLLDKLNPLAWNVPIANRDGTPTNEFMRKWLQQQATNGTIPDLTNAAAVSAVLDILGFAQGDILYRDTKLWKVLTPGTAGFILKTGGPSADPAWESISAALDGIGNTAGDVLYRAGSAWAVLAPGSDGQLLQYNATTHAPEWSSISGVLLGSGVPSALEPAGTLYSRTDAAGVYSSQPITSAPAVVQSASTSGASSAIGAPTLPGNPTVGNLLIAIVGSNSDIGAHIAAGWTSFVNGGATRFGRALYRYVQVGDVAALPAIGSGGGFFWFAEVWEISGVTGTFATDVAATSSIQDQTAGFNTPAGSTTANGQLVLLGEGSYNGTGNVTNPAGWTSDILTFDNADYGSWLGSHEAFPTSGTSYSATMTVSNAGGTNTAFAISVVMQNSGVLTANWTLIGPGGSGMTSAQVFARSFVGF